MPISSTDLVFYSAQYVPEDDTSQVGGAIDTTSRPDIKLMSATETVSVVSDSATDTRTVTLVGRDSSGALVTENLTLNGTTAVSSSTAFERLLKIVLSAADGSATVTVSGTSSGTIATVTPGETKRHAFFINSASSDVVETRYEKMFCKNNHASLTLNSAAVTLTSDPSGKIRIGLMDVKNDTRSEANRKTTPKLTDGVTAVTFVDDNVELSVPGNQLEAASAIGIWVEQTLNANDAPVRSTFTVQIKGTSV